ncbi:MAG: CYTH domain-containing protein [Nanoarchaeota archaeon]|nr:CYTH domain-containing protein [Nanoarchaeota archaeon]
MVWLEVETKVPLRDSEVKNLRNSIKKIAKLKKKGKKIDDYFAIKQKTYPKKSFRIRNMRDHSELTFKRPVKKYYTKEVVVKQEFEFSLDDSEQKEDMLELFKDIGIVEWVRKDKRNETYSYKKNKKVSIEINYVKHLGYFMEIEYLCQEKEVKKATKLITKVLRELDIKPGRVNNKGYTRLLWDMNKTGKKYFV